MVLFLRFLLMLIYRHSWVVVQYAMNSLEYLRISVSFKNPNGRRHLVLLRQCTDFYPTFFNSSAKKFNTNPAPLKKYGFLNIFLSSTTKRLI